MPTKPSYQTKDLEGARFEAQVLQRLSELKDDIGTALKILERHDTQLQDLYTKDKLRERDVDLIARRVDAFDVRLQTATSAPVETKQVVDQTKRDLDNVFLRLRGIETKVEVIDIDKLKKWNDDGVPILRFTKWAGALVVGNLIVSVYLAVKAMFP